MKAKSLRHMRVDPSIARLAAKDVRHLLGAADQVARPSKYKAKREEVDGYNFASGREANEYRRLKLLLRAGEIHDLVLQPRFPIVINGVKICEYRGDFQYVDRMGASHVVDAKGVRTQVFAIKKKLMKVLLGIDVEEV